MPEPPATLAAARCPDCGTELPPSLLACPACHRLLHADTLRQLAAHAEAAEARGDATAALGHWRRALELLPAGSRQGERIRARVADLSRRLETAPGGGILAGPPPGSRWARWLAPLGVVGLALWKFKVVIALVLTKGKLLLLGLTQTTTLFSMLLAFTVYWTAWGWRFALGLVGSMYVHEMGHVAALRRLGIRATAPMFIPGFGAFVRMQQYPADAREDARVGLAGPVWGLAAAVAAWAVWAATTQPFWGGVARASAWLNLFNLLPVWQLDGGRGLRVLSRRQRWLLVAVLAAAWAVTREGLLVLLLLVAGLRAFPRQGGPGDRRALAEFVLLVLALSALCTIRLPDLALS